MNPIVVVHGGCGFHQVSAEGRVDGAKDAVREGYKRMMEGGSALDAVEAAVFSMEQNEHFDAGYGSVLTIEGEVEMEASIMSGTALETGGVALIKDFPNPISIARKVMTDSPHALLGGDGAKKFALKMGFETVPRESLITPFARKNLDWFFKRGSLYGKCNLSTTPGLDDMGTVGAVAIDAQGHMAVAGSTGGIGGKAAGQIGATCRLGCGVYVDDKIGGVALTGHGDATTRYCLAHTIIKIMETGVDANTAMKQAITDMSSRIKYASYSIMSGGVSISKDGDVGVYFKSKQMPWAYTKDGKIYCGIEPGQVIEDDL